MIEETREAKLERALAGLIADILDHWEGDERDLDVAAESLIREFGLRDLVAQIRDAE